MTNIIHRIRRLASLRFEDEELEKAFRSYAFRESLIRVRLSLLLAIFLYAAFGILDEQIIPEAKHEAWVIRYFIFCPLTFAVFVISYFSIFQRIFLFCLWLLGFVGGAGIVVMIALSSPPGSYFYYAGLLLTSMFYFVFLRLSFAVATALAWTIFCLYQFVAIFVTEVPNPVLLNNTFFFISFNITGMWACYSMEHYMRIGFLSQREIIGQKEKFGMIFEHSPVGIMTISIDGEIKDANGALLKILDFKGLEKTEPINALYFPFFVDTGISAFIKDCMTKVELVSAEIPYSHKSGAQSYLRLLITPIFNEHGQLKGCQALVEDIFPRKKSEMDLRESEGRFRALLESSPDPVAVYDQNGFVTYLNPSFEQTFGWSQEELLGKKIDYVPEHEVARSLETIRMLYEGVPVNCFETRRLTKTGEVLDINISGALVRDRAGIPVGSMITLRDITQKKLVEKELKSSEERYRLLIESSPIGIGIIQDRKFVYANPALTETFGCDSSSDIVGEPPSTFVAQENMGTVFSDGGAETGKSGEIQNYEISGIKKGGQSFSASVWTRNIDFQGAPAVLSFVADITQEKSLRTQLLQAQKLEAVGTLAGGVAHDFNNLLQAVIGYSEVLILRKQTSDRDFADIQKICEAGKRGAELVKSLLTFSQKIEPRHIPVDLNSEILQIQNLLIHTIPKTITIDLDLSDDLQKIYADPSQIGQIILNLAVNARDAMPEGGRIAISTINTKISDNSSDSNQGVEAGDYVLLTVSDSGFGIDEELIPHIFEPFFTTKEVGKGTGLGLATVYGIVKQHNGFITCFSRPGVGTTFNIYFRPVPIYNDVKELSLETPLIGGTETILFVEDEALVRNLGSEILSSFGYDVTMAENGKQALEIFNKEKERISLVILDLIMPEMDGRMCMKEMLRMDPGVRVLIASGYAEDLNLDDDILNSARGFIRKPYDMRALVKSVREVFDNGSLTDLSSR